jgi:dolichol kinase
MKNILISAEINRKILHMFFAIFPITLFYLEDDLVLKLTFAFSLIVILGDLILRYVLPIGKLQKLFYRENELKKEKISGASWLAASCFIAVLLFDKYAYIPAMLAVAFSDSLSALIGRKYGKNKVFNSNKSWQGFFGFLIGGVPIYLVMSLIGLDIALNVFLIALLVAAIAELMEFIDDNFSIIISFSLVGQFLF